MRLPVFDRRRAGVLLPRSALEAALGRGGRAFIDWVATAGFSVWQILPVGPVGEDRSPYWVRCDCAGNAAFIDAAELPDPNAPIDAEFLAASGPWLHDYALFEALTRAHGGAPFWSWPPPLRDRAPEALAQAAHELAPEVARIEREQYAFHVQWNQLRAHARSRGVRLFGDLPFYVGPSSVGSWGAPRAVPPHSHRRAGLRRGRAVGLLRGTRPAVGQSGIRLAGAAPHRLRLVAGAGARAAGAQRFAGHPCFPGACGPRGGAVRRRRCTRRRVAQHSGRA